ncbi:MAG: ABC transporter substrate-binding protein, partial [Burkholderiaceae bacterium]
ISHVKQRDGIIDEALELRRLKLALEQTVLTSDARADGFGDVNGSRLSLMASQVSDAFGTKERVNPNAVWNGSLLPVASERNIFAVPTKK